MRLSSLAAVALLLFALPASAVDVTFTYAPPPGTQPQSCALRGSMNGWGETPMTPGDDGTWSVTVDLEPGEHRYKFFIDGEWPSNMETDRDGGPVDPEASGYVDDGFGGQNAVRAVGGGGAGGGDGAAAATAPAGPAAPLRDDSCRIHYHRPDGNYTGWGLHVWEETTESVTWQSPLPAAGRDDFGPYWDVGLAEGAERIGFLIHRGDEKDPGSDQFLAPGKDGREVWIVSGREEVYPERPDIALLALGDLGSARAYWLDARTIGWWVFVPPGGTARLHASPDGDLELGPDGVAGGRSFDLRPARAGLPAAVREKFPHLAHLRAFRLPHEAVDAAPDLLRGQLAVSFTDGDGNLRDATGLQIPGVLDDLFAWDGPLGITWENGVPEFRLWAPTARSVRLLVFDSPSPASRTETVPMTESGGVWSVTGRARWKNHPYLYEVDVWVPSTGRVERNHVTDPYSRGLTRNSRRSLIVDLDDPALAPDGWRSLAKPALSAPEDIVLYELHVRDFSASDGSVPEELRGTFRAFTLESRGTRHLRSLADAGLTHVHLLPVFDIATVNENRSTWSDPGDLSAFAADSEEQQAAVERTRGGDGFNWGYDPFHYGVPEGSYSTNPEGTARILEFREMVAALSAMGLRVVMDVVYNHTNTSGQSDRSVLDRIVPGYYHRLNDAGAVETSTCCRNTATEHFMMERLMLDDLVHWATDYKVDGFRFDLMGHHMKRNLTAARDRLHALTPEKDGVDGGAIYLYGEGWDFGEVQGGRRGPNATQAGMAGTGVGTFNDRIRDAIRGGNPFNDRREQGFATGLHVLPSAWGKTQRSAARPDDALRLMDRIRVGLAGDLHSYRFTDRSGLETRGAEHDNGGYTADPQESINYVSAHDNETLFDKIQFAAAEGASRQDRIRMQRLALSLVALAQGVPFFHAGSEMLRSKSMDRDSYDSGDWFNRLDFTYRTNHFGMGLPIADKNRERWNLIGPLLADPSLRPEPEEIRGTVEHFREMLRIRASSPLFRLRTAEDVQARVRFHNTGREQVPGLLVMSLDDRVPGGADLDPEAEGIVVVFAGTPREVRWEMPEWRGRRLALHPVQAGGSDDAVRRARWDEDSGSLTVPAWTAAVFVDRGSE